MNCQRGLWPLYRRLIKSSNSPTISKSTKRFKAYKSEDPFVLPRVVIDLEAPENPAVRDYDELKDNISTPHQQQITRAIEKAIARRVQLVRKQKKEGVQVFPRRTGKKNQRIRDDALEHELAYNPDASPPPVTAMDLMTYALLGNPFRKRGHVHRSNGIEVRDIHMERLFMAHGIDYLDTANMTIRALTEDFDIKTDGQVKESVNTKVNRKIAERRNIAIGKLKIDEQENVAELNEEQIGNPLFGEGIGADVKS